MALSPSQSAALAELYRRGVMAPQRAAAYEEMVRRGAVQDPYAAARVAEKADGWGTAGGATQTFANSIPFLSEASAGLKAGAAALGDAVAGRHGPNDGFAADWNQARAQQAGYADQFKADHPTLASTAQGLGYGAQMVGALATGGASEAPVAVNALRGGLVAGAKRFGARTARNAITGAGVAAVNGAAQPGTLQQRATNALKSAPVGALAGVAVPAYVATLRAGGRIVGAVAPRVGAVVSETADAASRALTGKSASDQSRVIPPEIAAKGQAAALDYLTHIGATPDQILAAKTAALGKPITTAEAIGPTGISQATGLARRAGTTPELADATLKARQGDRMSRILNDIHDTTGVDPEAAKGNIDALVAAGRAKADPLFDAIRAQGAPVISPELDSILNTPAGKQATAGAVTDLQNARIDPRAHGFVLGPPATPGAPPLPEPSANDLANALSAIKESRATQTGGLFRAIQELGGMRLTDSAGSRLTVGPDVESALAGRKVPGLINNQGGMTPENMAQALQDRGWFEPNVTDPSQAFEDALSKHARGSPVFKPGAYAADTADRAQGFDQEAQNAGVLDSDRPLVAARKLAEFRNADAQERAAIQAEGSVDPFTAEFDRLSAPRVSVEGLTPHALDLVRQNLGGMVERDAFGKVLPDSVSRGNFNINKVRGDLTSALSGTVDEPGLIPGYREALDTSGDYLSVKGAYDRAQGRLFGTSGTANDPRNFDTYFNGLSQAEQDATRASLANDVFTKLNINQLGPGSFNVPAVQQKLVTAFGPDQAQDLIAKMKVEADMSAAGARMQPNLNSVTGDVAGSQADQGGAQAAMGFAKAGFNALSGRPIAAAHSLASGLAPFVSAARQPLDMASRNALGDILYSDPADAAAQLSSRINAFTAKPVDTAIPQSVSALQNAFAIMAANRGGDSDQPNQ